MSITYMHIGRHAADYDHYVQTRGQTGIANMPDTFWILVLQECRLNIFQPSPKLKRKLIKGPISRSALPCFIHSREGNSATTLSREQHELHEVRQKAALQYKGRGYEGSRETSKHSGSFNIKPPRTAREDSRPFVRRSDCPG